MKGNIWTVAVVGVFLGVLLQAADLSYDSGAGGMTAQIADLFAPFSTILGIMFVVACAGAFITVFTGGGSSF